MSAPFLLDITTRCTISGNACVTGNKGSSWNPLGTQLFRQLPSKAQFKLYTLYLRQTCI